MVDLEDLGDVKYCGVSYNQIVLVMDNDEVITVSEDGYTRKSGGGIGKF